MMNKIRNFFIPCAEKLDREFHAHIMAAERLKKAIENAPENVIRSIRTLAHHDFETPAQRIRELTQTERRKYDRPNPHLVSNKNVHGDAWSVFSR